jgi:hypothetical protein
MLRRFRIQEDKKCLTKIDKKLRNFIVGSAGCSVVEPKIFLSAPAPDSFIRYHKNYLF